MPSQRVSTAMTWIGDFATLDVPTMLSRRTDDCVHTFHPASVGIPAKDNMAFGEHVSRLRGVLKSFPVTATEVMEDESKNMVIIHATSQLFVHEHLKDDSIPGEDWTYRGEYIFMLTMNEDGDKVRKIAEFVDSKGTERALKLIQMAQSNLQRASTGKA